MITSFIILPHHHLSHHRDDELNSSASSPASSSYPKHVFTQLLLAHSAIVSSLQQDSCGELFAKRSASSSKSQEACCSLREGQCEACHAAASGCCCLHRNFVTKPNNYLTIISYYTYTSIIMFSILFKFIILFSLFCPITANSKLVIVGQNRNNNYKFGIAQQYFPEITNVFKDSRASFYVFTQNSCKHNVIVEDIYSQCYQLQSPSVANFSTIIVSQRGTDEMNFSEIEIFYNYLDKENPLLLIEIGDKAVQTQALLRKASKCWGEAQASIISPNKAYLCNDFQPVMARDLISTQHVQLIEQHPTLPKPMAEKAFWPCIFVSASPKLKKSRENPKIHVEIHEEEDKDDQDEAEDDINEATSNYRPHQAPKKAEEKKLECKYRKSCYLTGTVPDIDLSYNFWPSTFSWNTNNLDDDDDNDDDEDVDGENVNRITALKLKCKYRLDCYKSKKIPLSLKEQEHNEKKAAAIEQSIPKAGKKKSLKDIAEKAVKKVKEAEEKAALRPLPKAVKIEKELDRIENELNKKLRCKYRKSCYETGELPESVLSSSSSFDSFASWPIFSSFSSQAADDDQADTRSYDELDDLEQKVYCKYRKSCYETGIKPIIQPEIQIHSFSDLKDLPDIVQTRKLTLQEKCKYRKSCYKTGILPDIHPPVEYVVEQKHISSVVPTNLQDLKHLCKYRKSCYQEIANSGTAEVVKNIRKRRLIEKEEKKRRHRRDRLRKRARGSIEFEEEIQQAAQVTKKVRKDKKLKSVDSEEVIEETPVINDSQEDVEEAEEEVRKPKRSLKKVRQDSKEDKKTEAVEKQKEAEEEEPEETLKAVKVEEEQVEQIVDKAPKKSLKKSKNVKKQTPKEEEKIVVAVPIIEPVVEEVPKKVVAEEKPKKSQKEPVKKQTKEIKAEKKVKKEVVAAAAAAAAADDDYKKNLAHKEYCKYRKSCYDTGERPSIDQSFSTMYTSFNKHVDNVYERQKPKSESDQKLDCKYRKSCYDTGRLPDIQNIRQQPIVVPKLDDIHDKKLHCKYRKSCYDEKLKDEADKLSKHTDSKVPKPSIQKVVTEQKMKKSADKKAEDDKKKSHTNDDDATADDDDDDDDDDDNDEQKKKVAYMDALSSKLNLEADEKLECKYRKSCYANVKPRSKNEDHSGSMARQNKSPIRTKCNEYYLSCREQLGLPPKEKAPIGPNGRRLCRKKKE